MNSRACGNPAKINPQTEFGIPTSNHIGYALESMLILESRSEVKVTVTQGWYTTFHHPKIHLHNFGFLHQMI